MATNFRVRVGLPRSPSRKSPNRVKRVMAISGRALAKLQGTQKRPSSTLRRGGKRIGPSVKRPSRALTVVGKATSSKSSKGGSGSGNS